MTYTYTLMGREYCGANKFFADQVGEGDAARFVVRMAFAGQRQDSNCMQASPAFKNRERAQEYADYMAGKIDRFVVDGEWQVSFKG